MTDYGHELLFGSFITPTAERPERPVALARLSEQRPFIDSVAFTGESAELQFWDEGDSMLDVASLALRLWSEHRESAGLPSWEVVGLEVVEKELRDRRGDRGGHRGGGSRPLGLHSPTPAQFRL